MERELLLTLTTDIVSAHVSANSVDCDDLPLLVRDVYDALANLGATPQPDNAKAIPAVSIKVSIASPDHILSMIDGRPLQVPEAPPRAPWLYAGDISRSVRASGRLPDGILKLLGGTPRACASRRPWPFEAKA